MARGGLSWRGATLAERLGFVSGRPGGAPAQDDVLAPWAKGCACGDRDALERRLAWDGIDPVAAARALAADPPPGIPEFPWVARLAELLDEVRSCARASTASEWRDEVSATIFDPEPPFIEAWIPLLRMARRSLQRRMPSLGRLLSRDAIASLEQQLLHEAAALGALAVFEDFALDRADAGARDRTYAGYTARLMEGRLAEVLDHYPVLARHLVLIADQWVDGTATLAERLSEDCAAIEETFGTPTGRVGRLVPGLSDRHAGGRSVARVEFESGLRLAYKPREVGVERAFHGWLQWLRECGLPDVPAPLRVLDRGTHGWVEWVNQAEFDSMDAVRAYFRSAGGLVCLAHILGAADLHAENLVASASGPALVDTEMLLQPISGGAAAADHALDDPGLGASTSCLGSGLVTLIIVGRDGRPFDVGGLQPAPPRETALTGRRWVNGRRANIKHVPVRTVRPSLANDVRLHGRRQRPEPFAGDVCEGFEATYRFLEGHRSRILADDGPLAGFANCSVRVLFRPSDQYGALQYLLAAPRYQRAGVDRSLALETLVRVFARETTRPALWPLVRDEREQLEQLDIPRLSLHAGASEISSSSGETIRGYYAESGLEAARRRVRALCPDDLAYQLAELRAALRGSGAPAVHKGRRPRDPGSAAEAIGAEIVETAVTGADGGLSWPACRGRLDLYSGAGGVAVFFAALAAVTGMPLWMDRARAALRGVDAGLAAGLPGSSPGLGGCRGLPSIAYAMTLSAHLLADAGVAARGAALARLISAELVERDEVLDVEGGTAGALLVLLAIDPAGLDPQLRALAGRCARRLVATQLVTGPDAGAWPAGADARPRPGFAHGAAGIACALSRWAALDPDPAWTAAVTRAWAFERRVFAENGGTWPAVRADGGRVLMAAWCHGAPGIGLARSTTPDAVADAAVAGEIEAAIGQALAAPGGQFDHLCCGNLGRADAALTAGLVKGRAEWIAGGRAIVSAVERRVAEQGRLGMRAQGTLRRAPAPGFFQGLAGIGYELLRAASPGALPSVLAFDPPAHQRLHIAR